MTKAPTTEAKSQPKPKSGQTEKLNKPAKQGVCSKCGRKYKSENSYYAAHIKKCTGKKVNGGSRPGAGRPSTADDPEVKEITETISKRNVRLSDKKTEMQEAIAGKTHQLIAHQLHIAMGNAQLFVRVKREEEVPRNSRRKKKDDEEDAEPQTRVRYDVYKVTEEADFMLYLSLPHEPLTGKAVDPDTSSEFFYMQGKGGNYYALTNLLDRAYGRPKESVELGEDPEKPITPIPGGTAALRKKYRDFIMEATKAPDDDAEVKSE